MTRLLFESYLLLIGIEVMLRRADLSAIHARVRDQQISFRQNRPGLAFTDISSAVDLACALFPKRVLCLQRAVATTIVLRRHGFPADMLIGVQLIPFKSHAWVEIDDQVVNDKPYMRDIYRVIDHC